MPVPLLISFLPFLLRGDADVIQPGDKVHLICAEEPSLNRDYRVTSQGTILVDFLGVVKVSGLNKASAAQQISDQLVSQKVLKSAKIRIDDVTASSNTSDSGVQSIRWSGQVDNPGSVTYRPGLTLADVWPSIRPAYGADISVIQIINPKASPRNIYLNGDSDMRKVELQPNDEIIFVSKIAPMTKVYVGGEVQTPGMYEVTSTSTVADLIREAGGAGPLADNDAITWQHGSTDGRPIKANDLTFHPTEGDRIMVGRKAPDVTIPVTGGVKKPGNISLYNGSRLSEAIDKAGGLAPGADPIHIKIFNPSDAKPTTVNYEDIVKGYTGDVQLKPGMKIEVPTTNKSKSDNTIKYAAGAALLLFLLGR